MLTDNQDSRGIKNLTVMIQTVKTQTVMIPMTQILMMMMMSQRERHWEVFYRGERFVTLGCLHRMEHVFTWLTVELLGILFPMRF